MTASLEAKGESEEAKKTLGQANDLNLGWLLQTMQGFYAGLGRTSDANAVKARLAGLPTPTY